jgi:hypothetical protein
MTTYFRLNVNAESEPVISSRRPETWSFDLSG